MYSFWIYSFCQNLKSIEEYTCALCIHQNQSEDGYPLRLIYQILEVVQWNQDKRKQRHGLHWIWLIFISEDEQKQLSFANNYILQ